MFGIKGKRTAFQFSFIMFTKTVSEMEKRLVLAGRIKAVRENHETSILTDFLVGYHIFEINRHLLWH